MKEVRKSIYIDRNIWKAIEKQMKEEGKSFNKLVNDVLLDYVVKKGIAEDELIRRVLCSIIDEHIDEIKEKINS